MSRMGIGYGGRSTARRGCRTRPGHPGIALGRTLRKRAIPKPLPRPYACSTRSGSALNDRAGTDARLEHAAPRQRPTYPSCILLTVYRLMTYVGNAQLLSGLSGASIRANRGVAGIELKICFEQHGVGHVIVFGISAPRAGDGPESGCPHELVVRRGCGRAADIVSRSAM